MNKQIIEFIFDFSGMEFSDEEWARIDAITKHYITQAGTSWSKEDERFSIKADKVERFLNKLLEMANQK